MERGIRHPARIIPFLWLALVVISGVATAFSWPDWWTWIAPEASLARELNTLMLLATSALAFLLWKWRFPEKTDSPGVVTGALPGRLVFAGLAVAFLGLAFDERMAIHERIRDRVLAPRDVMLPFVPWGEPGDVVLVVVALVGLALLKPVLSVLAVHPAAQRWFVAGVLLSAVAVALDTLPIESYELRNEIYFQSGEEAIELMGAACFLCSMLLLVDQAMAKRRHDDGLVRVASGLEID